MSEAIDKRIAALKNLSSEAARTTELKSVIYESLQASECLLIEAYKHSLEQSGEPAAVDLTCESTAGGYIEFGGYLHWLNNPPDGYLIGRTVKAIVAALLFIEGTPLPPSEITIAEYDKIIEQAETNGIVALDGTIYGKAPYEGLDPLWILVLFHFIFSIILSPHPFGTTPGTFYLKRLSSGLFPYLKSFFPGLFSPKNSEITIAIIGDWGTGKYGDDGGPAIAVLADVESLNPDYIVHLGDVYYAGTDSTEPHHEYLMGEEWDNFVNLWPKKYASGNSFTLNSNHEMYGGANGYFKIALGSGAPFAHQKNTSYFALIYGDWVVIGLDSAYYASRSNLYLTGRLDGNVIKTQAKWVERNFGHLKGKNVIVLTHHNGLDYTGENREDPLWTEVCNAVGGDGPAYWYWGHIHNGIVYTDKSAAGSAVKVRCVGHSAIPFGKAWALEKDEIKRNIAYFARTPIPNSLKKVRNGFATITLTSEGGITEKFYETTDTPGTPKLAWSSDT